MPAKKVGTAGIGGARQRRVAGTKPAMKANAGTPQSP